MLSVLLCHASSTKLGAIKNIIYLDWTYLILINILFENSRFDSKIVHGLAGATNLSNFSDNLKIFETSADISLFMSQSLFISQSLL